MNLRASTVQAIGEKVTTVCELGGVGLGYILPESCWKDGKVPVENLAFQSGGNGFYYPKKFKQVLRDGGQGYKDVVNRLVSGGGVSRAYSL
jgi:hypothetical protein